MVIERETGQGSSQSGEAVQRVRPLPPPHYVPDSRCPRRTIAFGAACSATTAQNLNSPETPVFHKGQSLRPVRGAQINQKLSRLLIVEGYMDVIALAQMDIRYAVATLGTATSGAHLTALFGWCPRLCSASMATSRTHRCVARARATLRRWKTVAKCASFFFPKAKTPIR